MICPVLLAAKKVVMKRTKLLQEVRKFARGCVSHDTQNILYIAKQVPQFTKTMQSAFCFTYPIVLPQAILYATRIRRAILAAHQDFPATVVVESPL